MSSGDRWAEKTTWKPTPHRDPIAGKLTESGGSRDISKVDEREQRKEDK